VDKDNGEGVGIALARQYHAALAMLREAVKRYPGDAWAGGVHTNEPWQVAYHALYFTHLYLQRHVDDFVPWQGQHSDAQHPDGIAGPRDPHSPLPLLPEPYSKQEVLAYCDFCDGLVDEWVGMLDLSSPESGFYWYPIPKLEHQLVSLRHLQHHTAQLADRLRHEAGVGVPWIGSRETGQGG
jgi:hypothetical protein